MASLPGTDALLQVLNYFHPLSPGAAEFLLKHLTPVSIRKRRLLLREGAVCNYVYFVCKGAVRGFIKDEGKDITTWITAENEMVTSISSLDVQAPSIENMQAIEDCELLALHYDDLEQLYTQFPLFNIVIRKLLQRYYLDAEGRAFIARLQSAEQKYRYFLVRHERLANRVPLKYIASFLGITLETLSRVRRKMLGRVENEN